MFIEILLIPSISTSVGPTLPNPPVHITVATLSHDQAVVEWTVSSISYTPEIYHVQYGLSPESMNSTSNATKITTDIHATNMLFSLPLTGLLFKHTYFYRVVAENSIGITESSVANFSTSSPGRNLIEVE